MAREFVRVEGLAGVLETLKQLPPEIVSKSGGPVKMALKRAAEVLRNEARANVQLIIDQPNADGQMSKSIGLLKKSVVASRGKLKAGLKGEAYKVRIKPRPFYPADRGTTLTPAQVGRLLETGTEKRKPMPWLRPAFDSKKNAAVQTFVEEMKKRTQVVINKVAAQNAGKK